MQTFLQLNEFGNRIEELTKQLKIFYKSDNEKVITLKTDIDPLIFGLFNHLEVDWLNHSTINLKFTGKGHAESGNWHRFLEAILGIYRVQPDKFKLPSSNHDFDGSYLAYEWLFKNANNDLADSSDEDIFYWMSILISFDTSEFSVYEFQKLHGNMNEALKRRML